LDIDPTFGVLFMAKHSEQLKLTVVREYLRGGGLLLKPPPPTLQRFTGLSARMSPVPANSIK